MLCGPAKGAWPVQSHSKNPDHNKHAAILLASFPGFMLPKQPYQGFYADPSIPCSKDREEDDNARAKGHVVLHVQTIWQDLREVQSRR